MDRSIDQSINQPSELVSPCWMAGWLPKSGSWTDLRPRNAFDIIYYPQVQMQIWSLQVQHVRPVIQTARRSRRSWPLPCNPTTGTAALVESNRICCLSLAPGKAPIVGSRQRIYIYIYTTTREPHLPFDSAGLAHLGATWDPEPSLGQTRPKPRQLSCPSLSAFQPAQLPSCPAAQPLVLPSQCAACLRIPVALILIKL
jgi:hypothetical protein